MKIESMLAHHCSWYPMRQYETIWGSVRHCLILFTLSHTASHALIFSHIFSEVEVWVEEVEGVVVV